MRRLHLLICFAAIFFFAFAPRSKGNISILFDYTFDTGNFFSPGSDARSRLDDAGAFFEGILGDDLDSITPSGGNSWETRFIEPTSGLPSEIFMNPVTINPTIPADTLIVYVGARDLGGSTLGEAGPGGFVSSGAGSWSSDIRQRGESGATSGTGASDFAPWGGTLAMDVDSVWDYGFDDSTLDPGENHFYSVLLHEISHVLGYGTSDSWSEQINGSNEFTGVASVAEYGGNVPLQSGGGHWTPDTDPGTGGDQVIMSNIYGTTTPQEVAMDPSIIVGTRKELTELDVAGLSDIGWEVVPEPSTGSLVLLALGGTALVRRRRLS